MRFDKRVPDLRWDRAKHGTAVPLVSYLRYFSSLWLPLRPGKCSYWIRQKGTLKPTTSVGLRVQRSCSMSRDFFKGLRIFFKICFLVILFASYFIYSFVLFLYFPFFKFFFKSISLSVLRLFDFIFCSYHSYKKPRFCTKNVAIWSPV